MAGKQRGKTGSLKKKAAKDVFTLELSDDEAPEEVTFADSKVEALRSIKHALDTARREKELLREKRRKRQELFQEQKKRKLLPTEVLEEIDSCPSKKQNQSEDRDEEEAAKEECTKLAHVRNLNGNYTVTTLKEREAVSFQRQAAEDFIQSRLYGPGRCRSTNNEVLSLQNKKGKNQRAAVQFVKKDWACEEKARAEKLKKRWIHKRQIPS